MNKYTFKITIKNQLAQLSWLIIVNSTIGFIFYHFFRFSLWGPLPYVYLWFILLDIVPTLLVHIQYYRANKDAILDISREFHTISYITPQETLNYNFDDIESFIRMDSWGAGAWYSFAEYRYYKIIFKDKREIVITSLMIKDIKNVLELFLNRWADKKRRPIAFIKK